MFVGGASGGSVIALNLAYYQTNSQNSQIAYGADDPNALNGINRAYYRGAATTPYSIRGVLNMWGAMVLPPATDVQTFFSGNTLPPVISFQGAADNVFAVSNTNIIFSPTNGFSSESICLLTNTPYVVNSNGNTAVDLIQYSSHIIYTNLINNNIPAELYFDCESGHGLDNCPGTCYQSNFGTSATSYIATNIYIVQRAATFFQAILNNTASTLLTTGHKNKIR